MNLNLELVTPENFSQIQDFISEQPQFGHHIKLPASHTLEVIKRELLRPPTDKDVTLYFITVDGKVIGASYYHLEKSRQSAKIAIAIASGMRNKSIGSRSLKKIIAILTHQHPAISYVETYVCCRNIASIKGLLNNGFDVSYLDRLGFLRENMTADGIQFALKLVKPQANDFYSHKTMKDPRNELKRLDTQSKASYAVEGPYLEALLKKLPNEISVLDLGCGTGAFIRSLSSICGSKVSFTGVDISDDFIEFAKGEDPTGEYIAADIQEFLSNTDRKFDFIASRYVLTHLPKEKIESVVRLIKEHLTESGLFYFVNLDPSGYQTSPPTPLQELIFKHKAMLRWKNGGIWTISHYLPAMIRNAGLSLQKIENFFLDTDRHVSMETFARSLGGQLIWAIENDWEPLALAAQEELDSWSKNPSSYGSVQVSAWVGTRK